MEVVPSLLLLFTIHQTANKTEILAHILMPIILFLGLMVVSSTMLAKLVRKKRYNGGFLKGRTLNSKKTMIYGYLND